MTQQPELDRIASQIITAVEDVWTAIQTRHPEVPDVIVTFGAGTIGAPRGTVTLGHFAPSRWGSNPQTGETPIHELFVGGEGLAAGATDLLGTLLHEATHALAHARAIKDTSRQGRYHNGRFRALAEEMGIEVAKVGNIGWSATTVPAETVDTYAAELVTLGLALRAYRRAEGMPALVPVGPGGQPIPGGTDTDTDTDGGPAPKPKKNIAAICDCPTPRRIRAAASIFDLGPITCGLCGQPFHRVL